MYKSKTLHSFGNIIVVYGDYDEKFVQNNVVNLENNFVQIKLIHNSSTDLVTWDTMKEILDIDNNVLLYSKCLPVIDFPETEKWRVLAYVF